MIDKTKILILEDEFINAKSLEFDLQDLGYDVIGIAMDSDEAMAIINDNEIDIAILDIQVKGEKSGIWLAEQLGTKFNVPCIFITGFGNRDIIDLAVKTKPVAYIQKPYTKGELYSALQLAQYKLKEASSLEATTSPVKAADNDSDAPSVDNIFIKNGDRIEKIIIDKILYILSDRNYVKIVFNDKEILIRASLKEWIDKLSDNPNFMQVHRSFVINIKHIDTIKYNSILMYTHEIPISPKYKEDLYKKLGYES